MPEIMKREGCVTLYCTEGGSDKQYTVWLEEKDGCWIVSAQWGRRGGSVQSGTKTPRPVSREEAEAVYWRVQNEKVRKGYRMEE